MITVELLKECRSEFEKYFQSLILDSPLHQARVEDIRKHSLKVVANSYLLAKVVIPTEEESRIAEVTALFHDIGKAVLIVQGDESPTNIQRDHATLSANLLRQMKFYPKLPDDIQLIILKTIENHSVQKLPKLDNEQQTLFARLLRDADKLEIFESSYRYFKERFGVQPFTTIDLINQVTISEKIIKSIMAGKSAYVEDMKTLNDYKLFLMSMTFDLNFKYSFRILSEKQYVQKIYETLPKRDQIIDSYRNIKLFIENKFIS